MSIENLPNDLFKNIFDYLDGYELYEAFSNLNYRFKQLLNSPLLLFKIKFHLTSNELYASFYKQMKLINRHQTYSLNLYLPLRNNHFFSSFFIDSSFNHLKFLILNQVEPDLLLSVLSKLSNVSRLSSLAIDTFNVLKYSRSPTTIVTSISTTATHMGNAQLNTKPKPASVELPPPQYQNLVLEQKIIENQIPEELYLGWEKLTDADMKIIAYYTIRKNETLITLSLWNNQMEALGAKHLAHALRNNTTLTTLYLYNNQIGDKGTKHLAHALQNNTTLTTLYLYNNQIGDNGAEHLAHVLRSNTTLTTLNVGYNQIEALGVQHLADALQHNTTLTILDFSGNQIEALGAQYLGHALRNNTTLTTLSLWNNQIGALGAKYLAHALRNNTTLTTLDLRLNQIVDKGAQYLADTLRHNTTLTTLDLRDNMHDNEDMTLVFL
ncbi:unnamed protein product [Rotaria sordida]|uniref:F-box domain-containing protein n=1 Tax=Rotaria sordida TaxID=392033 RepID=A0A814YNP4_9BILA|nr:unnamed protein product [Rotaria sordida]